MYAITCEPLRALVGNSGFAFATEPEFVQELSPVKLSVRKEALGKLVQAKASTKDTVTKPQHFVYCLIYKTTFNLFSLLVGP